MTDQPDVGKFGHVRTLNELAPADQDLADAVAADVRRLCPPSDPPVWAEQPHHRQARTRTTAEHAALTTRETR